jgi:hypothetical protein
LQQNINAQTATMQKDADKIPVWPVVSLGFVWKF